MVSRKLGSKVALHTQRSSGIAIASVVAAVVSIAVVVSIVSAIVSIAAVVSAVVSTIVSTVVRGSSSGGRTDERASLVFLVSERSGTMHELVLTTAGVPGTREAPGPFGGAREALGGATEAVG